MVITYFKIVIYFSDLHCEMSRVKNLELESLQP